MRCVSSLPGSPLQTGTSCRKQRLQGGKKPLANTSRPLRSAQPRPGLSVCSLPCISHQEQPAPCSQRSSACTGPACITPVPFGAQRIRSPHCPIAPAGLRLGLAGFHGGKLQAWVMEMALGVSQERSHADRALPWHPVLVGQRCPALAEGHSRCFASCSPLVFSLLSVPLPASTVLLRMGTKGWLQMGRGTWEEQGHLQLTDPA